MKNLPTGYVKSLIRIFLTGIVIAGSLNYGLTALNYNLIEMSSNKIDNFFNIEIIKTLKTRIKKTSMSVQLIKR